MTGKSVGLSIGLSLISMHVTNRPRQTLVIGMDI
jgi:hypothetical protein